MPFLDFIELRGFSEDWQLLRLTIDDLIELQQYLLEAPGPAPVIPGTGGLRKIRFAPARWRVGKRGAVRVCYVYFSGVACVLFVMAYAKNRKDELLPDEKKAIRLYLQRKEEALARNKKDRR